MATFPTVDVVAVITGRDFNNKGRVLNLLSYLEGGQATEEEYFELLIRWRNYLVSYILKSQNYKIN